MNIVNLNTVIAELVIQYYERFINGLTIKNCKKKCNTDKICNLASGNCVLRTGAVGKKISGVSIISNKITNDNNETLGMTVEQIFCNLSGIQCHINPERVNINFNNIESIICSVQNIIEKIPRIVKHVGEKNECADFILENGLKLSVKTNKIYPPKVCPQNIGQTTKKKWLSVLFPEYKLSRTNINDQIKNLILNNTKYLLEQYFQNLFSCDLIAWIYLGKNRKYISRVIPNNYDSYLNFSDILSKSIISFTAVENWVESTTTKLNGISIGEFQIHQHRDGVKFRFFLDTLLNMIDL